MYYGLPRVGREEMLSLFLFPAIAFAHLTMRSFAGGGGDDESPFPARTPIVVAPKSRWRSRNWAESAKREGKGNHGLV